MFTLSLIILAIVLVSFGVVKFVKYVSYSEEEERVPVENYDVIKPKKSSKPRKAAVKKTTKK